MISLVYFIRLAINNLRRGGQRVIVALLCITFAITVLVAMTMLAKSIENTVMMEPAQIIGGDLSLVRKTEDTIRPEDVNQLNSLQQSGKISRYTLIAYNNISIVFHTPGSGELHFVGNGMGIESDKYPLAGSLTIGEPGSIGLATLLQQAGDLVITRDIAQEYHLKVGDSVIMSDLRIGVPMKGIVRGIAYDTPNHQGDKVYYTAETAQKLANGQPVVNTAIVNTSQAATVTTALESSGWSVDWAANGRNKQTANLWVIGLRGAGLLGLLVGGIGIANTMQVLLRRRQGEIAIWKTLGYHAGDLRLVFSLEAGLLGLAGSLLGAALGVLISGQVLELLRRTSTVLYEWRFSLSPPLIGILVGTLTTVIFAYWAIVIYSQARPMALLRNEPVDIQQIPGCQSAMLGILLAAPFMALTSLVMGSVTAGIGVLAGIGFGIAMLGGFFSGLLWLCTRFLSLPGFPLVRMALNSLRRRGLALVFAMIALFVGIFSMSLGLGVMQFGESRFSGGSSDFQGTNLTILAAADQESIIRKAVQGQNPVKVSVGYQTALKGLSMADGEPVAATEAVLVGRADPEDYLISGPEREHTADWAIRPDGVYAYKGANLKTGSQVEATFRDGTTKTFTVIGSYELKYRSINLYPPLGLLMSADAFTRAARPDSLTCFVQVAPNQLSHTATVLGANLPQATVVNLVAYAARFMQSYQKVFALPMLMAGVALLAGLLLIANSVSLAMLDRRYEIGILKTVGYSHPQILSIFAVEYGLVSFLATSAGIFVIQGLLAVLALAQHIAVGILLLSLPALVLLAVCGIGLTLLTVFGVTWVPTRVSPLVVLNEVNG